MGVIYELLSLPEKDKKKFLDEIIQQEAAKNKKLKPRLSSTLQNKQNR